MHAVLPLMVAFVSFVECLILHAAIMVDFVLSVMCLIPSMCENTLHEGDIPENQHHALPPCQASGAPHHFMDKENKDERNCQGNWRMGNSAPSGCGP